MLEARLKVIDVSGRTLTPAQFRKRINTFNKRLSDLPKSVYEKLPKTFSASLSNKVRSYWKQNYISRRDWKRTSHTQLGGRVKDYQFERGDTFKLDPMGKLDMNGSSSTFGLRTGNLMQAIGSPVGTSVMTRVSKLDSPKERSFFLGVVVGVNSDVFDGQNNLRFTGGDSDKAHPVSRPNGEGNYLYHFSRLITKGDPSSTSVLVRLGKDQLGAITDWMRENWSVRARDTVLLQLVNPFLGK